MLPDAWCVILLAANALTLSAALFFTNRARRAARRAAHSAFLARCDRTDARKFAAEAREHAERLDLPRLLPFPRERVRGPFLHRPDDGTGVEVESRA